MSAPSQANAEAFNAAVEELTELTLKLFDKLEVRAAPRSREIEGAPQTRH